MSQYCVCILFRNLVRSQFRFCGRSARLCSGRKSQKYAALSEQTKDLLEKYKKILKNGFVSMDMAQNILVVKTVAGMAMAVAAALDAMDCHEIVGSIAGDDTVMCAVRTVEDTETLMERLRKIIEG